MTKKSVVTNTTYRCWCNANEDIPADSISGMTDLEILAKFCGEKTTPEKYAVVYDDTYNDVYEVHVFDNYNSAVGFICLVARKEYKNAVSKYGEANVRFEYSIDFTYAYISDLSKDWEIELNITKVIAH